MTVHLAGPVLAALPGSPSAAVAQIAVRATSTAPQWGEPFYDALMSSSGGDACTRRGKRGGTLATLMLPAPWLARGSG